MEIPHSLITNTTISDDLDEYISRESSDPDVEIVTSASTRIPAHSAVLVSVSPVFESIIERKSKDHGSSKKTIAITGVPCAAVSSFLHFIYSSRCSEEELERYGIHLLALSHVYAIPQLKQRSSKAVGEKLNVEYVVDVLQLARLCDAPELYLKCMKFISNKFKAVEATEGWKFLNENDPWLELQILHFIEEAISRKKRRRRHREEQRSYMELSEAMECLEHICSEGCTIVGPSDMDAKVKKGPCKKFLTCQGLQLLIKHFAMCKPRVNGGCLRCKRMWQLLRLHSSICDRPDSCMVPLCRQFKLKTKQEKKDDDALWELLARKVVSARAMSTLSIAKRKEKLS